jgi:hypothetical protein
VPLLNNGEDFNKRFRYDPYDNDRLNAIRQLIRKKRESKDNQMSCRIDNKFIDQMLIFSQLNAVQIKDALQEDCLKQAFEQVDSDEYDAEELDLDASMREWIKKDKQESRAVSRKAAK